MTNRTIDIPAFRRLIDNQSTLLIVDVRDEDKFLAGTLLVEGIQTLHFPYLHMKDHEDAFTDDLISKWKDAHIVTVCTTGNKAGKAADLLREKGLQACSLEGGLTAWNASTST